MGRVSTRDTEELGLRATIAPRTMPTPTTRFARRGGVHVDHSHTRQSSVVGNEGPQLQERPPVQHAPLALGNRSLRASAFADPLPIFEGNQTRGALRRLHEGPAEAVIQV